MVLAAVLLARDCEDTLPKCLDSIAPHVDIVLALMVGESQDATEEILERYDAGYAQVPWDWDFSKARNQLFENARSIGVDWAILVDADDEVLGGEELRAVINRLEAEKDATAYVRVHFGSLSYYQKRIFNLKVLGKWVGRVHETYASEGVIGRVTELEIRHQRGKKAFKDIDRNLEIFRRWLEETPQEFDAHIYYCYANELLWHAMWEDAARVYGLALGLPQWKDESYFTHIRRGVCYMRVEAWQQAWEEFCAAAKIYPEWRDAYSYMARWLYYRGIYGACLNMSEFASTKSRPDTIMPLSKTEYKEEAILVAKAREALAAQ